KKDRIDDAICDLPPRRSRARSRSAAWRTSCGIERCGLPGPDWSGVEVAGGEGWNRAVAENAAEERGCAGLRSQDSRADPAPIQDHLCGPELSRSCDRVEHGNSAGPDNF